MSEEKSKPWGFPLLSGMGMGNIEEMLAEWGFEFNPFTCLNAAKDPAIIRYMVIPVNAMITIKPCSALIFAPTGGGKTALRIYTTHSFQDLSGRSFVITYLPQYPQQLKKSRFLEEHLHQLSKCLMEDVFLFLLHSPLLYLQWEAKDKRVLLQLLDLHLPLSFFRSQIDPHNIRETIQILSQQLHRPIAQIPYPAADEVASFLNEFDQDLETLSANPVQRDFEFHDIARLIQRLLHVREFFILFDESDAYPETAPETETGAAALAQWIQPLVKQAAIWEEGNRQIYLKAFLTIETEQPLKNLFPKKQLPVSTARIQWDDILLTDVIRRRVNAATGGMFGELSAVADRGVRSVEAAIVAALPENRRWPRELMKKTTELFEACYHRCKAQDAEFLITADDIHLLSSNEQSEEDGG